jgi:hypothetical protein
LQCDLEIKPVLAKDLTNVAWTKCIRCLIVASLTTQEATCGTVVSSGHAPAGLETAAQSEAYIGRVGNLLDQGSNAINPGTEQFLGDFVAPLAERVSADLFVDASA